jgi:hypothetical protein
MSKAFSYTLITINLLILSGFQTTLCSPSYEQQAHEWVRRYVLTNSGVLALSTHDAQHLANLLYYSYQRSTATIHAQKDALPLLDALWKSWQNVAQTRMNPSRTRPYQALAAKQIAALRTYVNTQDAYHNAQESYATVSNFVVKGNAVQSPHLKDGIKELRTAARTVVSQALLDVKNHVTKLSTYIGTKKMVDEQMLTKTTMREFFTSYIPQLAVKSFVETEQGTNTISDESWRLLFGMQEVSSYVWHTLEERRAEFYRAHYQELYRALQKFDTHAAIFSSIIHENEKLPSLTNQPMIKKFSSSNLQDSEFYSN